MITYIPKIISFVGNGTLSILVEEAVTTLLVDNFHHECEALGSFDIATSGSTC